MRRTGYVRPWYSASCGNLNCGPSYFFMRETIGSRALPVVEGLQCSP